MGAEAYWYYMEYQSDVATTLEMLRERELKAGRYNPVIPFPEFPITVGTLSPGAKHPSIEAVMESLMAMGSVDGTRSILDIQYVSDTPFPHKDWESLLETAHLEGRMYHFTTYPLSKNELFALFGTDKPTHELVDLVLFSDVLGSESARQFWSNIERGTSKHIIIYDGNKPTEVLFAGYSFD